MVYVFHDMVCEFGRISGVIETTKPQMTLVSVVGLLAFGEDGTTIIMHSNEWLRRSQMVELI